MARNNPNINEKSIIKSIAAKGLKVDYLKLINSGINSKSFYLKTSTNKRILKIYPEIDYLGRNRLINELMFLQFLKKNNFDNVPEPLLWDEDKNWMILSWLEGSNVKNIESRHITELVNFILNIQKCKLKQEAKILNEASEAFFDMDGHILCVEKRIDNLNKIFIKRDLEKNKFKFFYELINNLHHEIRTIKINLENSASYHLINKKLNSKRRIISQSDVGFHNIFEIKDFKLQFYDFEYAGWDDPHKMIADLVLQPDKPVPIKFLRELKPLMSIYINSKVDFERFSLVIQIYRLKWLLIICNKLINEINSDDGINKLKTKLEIYAFESISRIKKLKEFINLNFSF